MLLLIIAISVAFAPTPCTPKSGMSLQNIRTDKASHTGYSEPAHSPSHPQQTPPIDGQRLFEEREAFVAAALVVK
jgi:hypothetical protein